MPLGPFCCIVANHYCSIPSNNSQGRGLLESVGRCADVATAVYSITGGHVVTIMRIAIIKKSPSFYHPPPLPWGNPPKNKNHQATKLIDSPIEQPDSSPTNIGRPFKLYIAPNNPHG